MRHLELTRGVASVFCVLLLGAITLAQPGPTDRDVYERFRDWVSRQPPIAVQQTSDNAKQPDRLTLYREVLRAQGVRPAEIDRQIGVINEQGRALEIERWNVILTSPKPSFNTSPNAFLMQIARTRTPGSALDVGMGQGRNAVYLVQQGWTVTGFDPAERAVAAAREQAQRLSVRLDSPSCGPSDVRVGPRQMGSDPLELCRRSPNGSTDPRKLATRRHPGDRGLPPRCHKNGINRWWRGF